MSKQDRIDEFEARLDRFEIPLGASAEFPLHDILDRVASKIRRLVDSDEVTLFYIGRSVDPDHRNQSAHKSDVNRAFFHTTGFNVIQAAEIELIDRFYDHSKNDNIHRGSPGDLGDPPYFVYVAFWIR